MHHPRERETGREKGVNCVKPGTKKEKEKKRKRGGKKVSGLWTGGEEASSHALYFRQSSLLVVTRFTWTKEEKRRERKKRQPIRRESGESNERKCGRNEEARSRRDLSLIRRGWRTRDEKSATRLAGSKNSPPQNHRVFLFLDDRKRKEPGRREERRREKRREERKREANGDEKGRC